MLKSWPGRYWATIVYAYAITVTADTFMAVVSGMFSVVFLASSVGAEGS
jgi:hypothetical protein